MIKDSSTNYGLISIVLHWLVAITVISLFGVGLWMVELDYYSEWYKTAPDLHKSFGISLFVLMLVRIGWRIGQTKPQPHSNHKRWEQLGAHIAHLLMYLLLFAIMLSGYFISTADGRGIEVFQILSVPSLGQIIENQEDIAGDIHEYLAYGLIALVVFHALGALKHHFIDKDSTLKRMLKTGD